ncbi:MAG: hypothetical protein WC635_11930 [Bacteriovorax sp.]
MTKMKILSLVMITLTSLITLTSANASSYCSEWTQQDRITCIFAGESANFYRRQCENPCGRYDSGACQKEEACYFDNPQTFESPCSEWTPVRGVTCYDPNSQSWEQSWVRACTIGLRETWCSREKPFN